MQQQNWHSASLRGEFMRYVPLNVLGMLALSCYILADTFFVANGIGPDGLTALNLVLPVYSFISGVGLLFGMGGATKYALLKSMGNHAEAKRYFTLTMLLCATAGVILMLAGLFFTDEICVKLGADTAILPLAKKYLYTIMLFSAAFITNNALVCFVRNDENPRVSMLAMLLGSLGNIVLDYIFVFPLQMGMFGAAIATCISPLIGIAVLSFHLFAQRSGLRFISIRFRWRDLSQVVSIGFSAFITEFSTGIVILVFNFVILALAGNIGVAAYGIVANVNLFAVAIFAGISEGVQPLISKYYGVADFSSLRKIYTWAIGLSAIIGLAVYIILFLSGETLVALFNRDNDANLARLAVKGVRLYFPMLFLSGINIVSASLFASISRPKAAFLISVLRSIVFIIGLIFVLSSLLGMPGVWYTMPCTEVLTFGVTILLLRHLSRSHKKIEID